MNCKICGRPLKNIESIAAGIGPVCAGGNYHSPKIKKQKNNNKEREFMFDNHAVFEIELATEIFVYIVDRGDHSKCKTVTNDAEWVVSELNNLIENFENKRLFYKDSDGQVDEIVHNGRFFISFKHGHAGVEL
jgi:hypothetical protein